MPQTITLRLLPSEAANEQSVKTYIASLAAVPLSSVNGYTITKQSIDARGKQTWINLTADAYINEPYPGRSLSQFRFDTLPASARRVVIIGGGPAGLFAALKLIENGIQPIILERGKDVRARRRDLAALNKEGVVNPESNYCFGEGGAGTYSDGKLYTRSSKRGDINRILNLFVRFGAEEQILYEAHPHIGTNKLPHIITAMRDMVLQCGGGFYFNQKVTGLQVDNNQVQAVVTANGDRFDADAVILATGHSARDIFELFVANRWRVDPKPFALGVRVEHPQALIDSLQYHGPVRDPFLPPASYSLVQQVAGKGVFSFCMCPGGIIAPAATAPGELVVNGWSPSKRNNPFANSGMVVTIEPGEALAWIKSQKKNNLSIHTDANDPLLLMKFQQAVEQKAYAAGGGKLVAPAQRVTDFTAKRLSTDLPECSYLPGVKSASMDKVLPSFVAKSLQEAFIAFGNKMKGYHTKEALVVATESRTSSPVRIPRSAETLEHPQLKNLYPCGEGAGYAGGIVSAAMDGERIAELLVQKLK